jgi:peroxiredoxin family protein
MKAILTLIFVLFFGLTAFAQNTNANDTVEPIKMGIVLDSGVITTGDTKEVKIDTEKSVARLYKFKNSRVKKALKFTTKKDKPKLA